MPWKLQVYLNQLLLRQEEVFDKANTRKASTGQGLRVFKETEQSGALRQAVTSASGY